MPLNTVSIEYCLYLSRNEPSTEPSDQASRILRKVVGAGAVQHETALSELHCSVAGKRLARQDAYFSLSKHWRKWESASPWICEIRPSLRFKISPISRSVSSS